MANNYLTDEQRQQFINQLGGGADPAAAEGNPQEAMPPVDDMGAEGAPVDAEAAAPAVPPVPPVDPNAAVLKELGFEDINGFVEAYKSNQSQISQYREMLTQLLSLEQAMKAENELDPSDPLNSVKQAVREEMAPLYEKLKNDAKNKLVQEAWGKDAANLPGVTDMMPEITEFMSKHPELSVADDGLRRAYEGIRSSKYKSEEELLKDGDFINRMASNSKIKDKVIQEYLSAAARNGSDVPTSINGGGNVPLTGKKSAPSSMDQAKKGLASMLGMK